MTTLSPDAPNIAQDLWFGFRSMFYMISQKELDEGGPNVIDKAVPWFIIFIAVEYLVGRLRGHRTYRLNDGMASLSLGMVSEQTKLWGRTWFLILYQEVYEKIGIELFKDPQSIQAFVTGLILVDFFYYWFHRFCHEFHFAFSQHSVHHSGEDYNLATALRQGALQWLIGMVFTLPLAVIVPPAGLFGHFFANTVAQFWFHTSQIGSLGPLEYILNTPSHHRMHHRPPGNCNYGGVFIVFDKLFGTFVPETEHLDYYGLAKQYDTFDPVWAHVEHASRVVKNVGEGSVNPVAALLRRRVKHKWTIDPMALFRPHPTPKQSFWVLPTKAYRKKLDMELPFVLNAYLVGLFLQQLITFLAQGEIQKQGILPLGPELLLRQALFFWTLSCLGRLLDGFSVGKSMNTFRVLVSPLIIAWFIPESPLMWYGSLVDLVVFVGVSMSLVGSKH